MVFHKIKMLLDMIKFEHTIFALPFAYLGMVLGARGMPNVWTWIWVTGALVGVRSYAMVVNRILDRAIDKKNPRTAHWALPSGRVTMREAVMFGAGALVLFFLSIAMLPSLCHVLWPVVLLPMTIYPLTKRFTALCHIVLGLCLGLAPLGAWVATTNSLPSPGILVLGLAVMCWTAGFDILYSCQDYEFDRQYALHSIPALLGIARALTIARLFHICAVALLASVGSFLSLGSLFYAGVALVAGFLWYEHTLISPQDLSRLNVAFFTLNGMVSVCAFLFTFLSVTFHL
ncbi:MAG: putative 4-hydroxybenzoate polyprenyltransferase [Desulfobacterota bacterium]|nr:putative 4-hydroxybenzoate polyprenyltransferase [Thermodesulfobacteriota bacterium]